jgi:hypothetical protein
MKVHSALRLTRHGACLLAAFVLLGCSISGAGQPPAMKGRDSRPTVRISEWENEQSGAEQFLRTMFTDIDPNSRVVAGEGNIRVNFLVFLCEPDFSGPKYECPLYADFLMTQSRFGTVPAWIHINVREHERRWMGLAVLLAAHPEWTAAEVRDAMKINGFNYGDWNRSGVKKAFKKALPKLEPFFGKLKVDLIVYQKFDVSDRTDFRPPRWLVEAHPEGREKGESTSFDFRIDAIDGRIIGVQSY